MTTTEKRKCGNCSSFDRASSECLNGVDSFDPRGSCDMHTTHDEDRAEDEALAYIGSQFPGMPLWQAVGAFRKARLQERLITRLVSMPWQ